MVDHRGTLTGDEHAVLVFLEAGPASLGPTTGETTRHRRPRLYDVSANIAMARLADDRNAAPLIVRTVEARLARRLADRGWVLIDPGGLVTLRPHRLAKPLPGGPGDGHSVVCSCGETFDSWDAAEAHQTAQETLS